MEIVKDVQEQSATNLKPPVRATYDPAKRYKWSQETTFNFTGGEFGVILNAVRQILSTREAQTILLAERASSLIEQALAQAVEAGEAVEDPQK